jgi:hypothetical protein
MKWFILAMFPDRPSDLEKECFENQQISGVFNVGIKEMKNFSALFKTMADSDTSFWDLMRI